MKINQIWKYSLNDTRSEFDLIMPIDAQVLSAQVQRGVPTIWALVDPAAPKESRRFALVQTGERFDAAGLSFVDTFVLDDGLYVVHLFEVTS